MSQGKRENSLLCRLKGGDRRSIGRSNDVVLHVKRAPSRFAEVMGGMVTDNDLLVRIRAADAAEKITAEHPEYLQPFKRLLLERAARSNLPEVRWHVAQMIPHLHLSRAERRAACAIIGGYLRDRSRIVRTCAMQALADLAERHRHLRPRARRTIKILTATGSPAMKSRGRKLLVRLASKPS